MLFILRLNQVFFNHHNPSSPVSKRSETSEIFLKVSCFSNRTVTSWLKTRFFPPFDLVSEHPRSSFAFSGRFLTSAGRNPTLCYLSWRVFLIPAETFFAFLGTSLQTPIWNHCSSFCCCCRLLWVTQVECRDSRCIPFFFYSLMGVFFEPNAHSISHLCHIFSTCFNDSSLSLLIKQWVWEWRTLIHARVLGL